MKFCQRCGKEILDDAVICPNCGCYAQTESNAVPNVSDESVSVGLIILSVIFPIFGLIYWPVKAKERPRCAKVCGAAAILSFTITFLCNFALTVLANISM